MSTTTHTVRSLLFSLCVFFFLPAAANAQARPHDDVLSLSLGGSAGHFEGGQTAHDQHGFLGFDLDARYYIRGEHGFGLRLQTAGTWGAGAGHVVEGRYTYRLFSDPSRPFGTALSFDAGMGTGALHVTQNRCVFSCVNNTTAYEEDYVPVYGVVAVRGDLRLGPVDIGAEVGVRTGTLTKFNHSGAPGARVLGSTFVSPYLGVRLGLAFNL